LSMTTTRSVGAGTGAAGPGAAPAGVADEGPDGGSGPEDEAGADVVGGAG
jgi:hypothetical protein